MGCCCKRLHWKESIHCRVSRSLVDLTKTKSKFFPFNQFIPQCINFNVQTEDASSSSQFVLAHPFCNDICIDARRSGSAIRFVRRSCKPNTHFKEVVGPDNTRHLALFSSEPLAADTEITMAFDRNWKTYSCNIRCACDTSDCVVLVFLFLTNFFFNTVNISIL